MVSRFIYFKIVTSIQIQIRSKIMIRYPTPYIDSFVSLFEMLLSSIGPIYTPPQTRGDEQMLRFHLKK
jgi:hypothetical protein